VIVETVIVNVTAPIVTKSVVVVVNVGVQKTVRTTVIANVSFQNGRLRLSKRFNESNSAFKPLTKMPQRKLGD
jgi:hypothetical protein